MDSGHLLVFIDTDNTWHQLLADLEASGASCTVANNLEDLLANAEKGGFEALLLPRALLEAHPDLAELQIPLLLAEDLAEGPESDLIDPFAQLGDRSVLSTLDRHLDRVEALIKTMEDQL